MADQLNSVVQRMIDAGESEDNIATVIQHYKAQSAQSTNISPVSPNETDNPYIAGAKAFGKNILDQFSNAGKFDKKDEPFTVHGSSPGVEKFVSTPLARPTGIDSIDGFLSPAGLAMLAGGAAQGLAGSPAARVATGKALNAVGDFDFRKPFKSTVGSAADALIRSGQPAAAPPPADAPISGQLRAVPTEPAAANESPLRTSNGYPISPETEAKIRARNPEAFGAAPAGRPQITVSGTMQEPAPLNERQQARRDVGAEVRARANGVTVQQEVDATGPIRGEDKGTRAGMPGVPANRQIDALKDMGPRGTDPAAYQADPAAAEAQREAYARGPQRDRPETPGEIKNRQQRQAYLDALRRVGLAIPLAGVPILRGRIVGQDNQP